MMGAAYWHFTVNELGEKDMAAQLDHIDATKRAELKKSVPHANNPTGPVTNLTGHHEPADDPQPQVRRPRYK